MNDNLRAIVDIGSNGIRFSISSLEPTQARIIPCLFQDRAAISLFDAQYKDGNNSNNSNNNNNSTNLSAADTPSNDTALSPMLTPEAQDDLVEDAPDLDPKQCIDKQTIEDVCQALLRFQLICKDFGVSSKNIHVIATEATREAKNSKEFQSKIQTTTGWTVNLLSKEDEARTGAYGVASSFYEVQGLFLDLGGGSVQLSWIICKDGDFRMSKRPISLPYGAAALTRRLNNLSENQTLIFEEIKDSFAQAVELIDMPEELTQAAKKSGGYKVYVSGGGFRGLGHVILARSGGEKNRYPLPIINGFSCTAEEMKSLICDILDGKTKVTKKSFRISERRATQLPAVSLLVSALFKSLPSIRKVLFSQGGVREGALFHELPLEVRCHDPMLVASQPYAPVFASTYVSKLRQGVPTIAPHAIRNRLVSAVCNVAFVHSSYPKDLQAAASLNIASTGILSGAHGLSHEIRALIGLALCQRWGGDISDKSEKEALIEVIQPKRLAWWATYCGHLMHVVGGVYPGGHVHGDALQFKTRDETFEGFTLVIEASEDSVSTVAPTVRPRINNLEKKLKKLQKEFGDAALRVYVEVNWV